MERRWAVLTGASVITVPPVHSIADIDALEWHLGVFLC